MFDGGHQDHHRLRCRRQNRAGLGLRSLSHLGFGLAGIGGQVNKSALVFLALDAGVLVKLPQEGTGIEPQALA